MNQDTAHIAELSRSHANNKLLPDISTNRRRFTPVLGGYERIGVMSGVRRLFIPLGDPLNQQAIQGCHI